MQLQTSEQIITVRLEVGETLQVMFHPEGINTPSITPSITLNGLTIATRLLDNGRMVLLLHPHHNNLYHDKLTNEVILVDDKNTPQSIKLDWQYGVMNLEKIDIKEIPEEA